MKKKLINLFFIIGLLSMFSCSPRHIQYVDRETLVYRDSLIERIDTQYIALPKEYVKETVKDTISRLETSVAESEATISGGMLTHSLKNKDVKLPTEVKWRDRVVYRDSTIVKTEIKEVPVAKPYIPKVFWWLLGYAIFTILGIIYILYKNKFNFLTIIKIIKTLL